MTTLATLVTQLESDVPTLNGTPTEAQYSQAVTDAVADLGRRVPLMKVLAFPIVSGTASYALPADFQRLIRLAPLLPAGEVLVTDAGLIPMSLPSQRLYERYTVAGTTLTFFPTPTYSIGRALWYAAKYVLTSGDYTDLTDDRAQIAMMRARSTALNLQAAKAAPTSMRIKSGDDDVDRTKVAETLRTMAKDWQEQYEAVVKGLIGPVGTRGGNPWGF